jgi:predicted RNA binding protein YcfA (HicA-like mRNA interferase family)
MPRVGPIGRRDLIVFLRRLGFDGPIAGGRHQVMVRASTKVPIPNPHQGDIGPKLLARILREAGISRDEWEAL